MLFFGDMMASEDGLREANGPVLKSQKSLHFSFIRFYNTTGRSVDVIWINYEGRRVKYKSIKPCEFLDVNTFVGHPWIFCDSDSGERMVVQLRDVFKPTAWDVDAQRVWPPKRKIINITIPVYSLQKCCLHAIKRFVPSDNIHKLDVTEIIRDEIYEIFRLTRPMKSTRNIGRVLMENQIVQSDT